MASALLLGTCDSGSVLSKLRGQQHILEQLWSLCVWEGWLVPTMRIQQWLDGQTFSYTDIVNYCSGSLSFRVSNACVHVHDTYDNAGDPREGGSGARTKEYCLAVICQEGDSSHSLKLYTRDTSECNYSWQRIKVSVRLDCDEYVPNSIRGPSGHTYNLNR